MPSMREIEDFVAEVERNTARARERAQGWTVTRIAEPIGGGLGQVVVNGYGVLLDVDLNADALRHTSERGLGPILRDAIIRAERRAEQKRIVERSSLI
jgi:DNA-binding protein YbaB